MSRPIIVRVLSAGLYMRAYSSFFQDQKLSRKSYKDALQQYRNAGFLYPSAFSEHMTNLGYVVHEIVADFLPLQHMWYFEQGNKDRPLGFSLDIFMEQLRVWQPDIVYFQEVDVVPVHIRSQLKSRFPTIKVLTGFKGFPPHVFSDYQDFDFLFIPYLAFQSKWNQAGVSTYFLPHCFDPGVQTSTESFSRSYDAVFVGSTGYGNANQEHRYTLLRTLLAQTPLEIWGLEQTPSVLKMYIRGAILFLLSLLPSGVLQLAKKEASHFSLLRSFLRDSLLVRNNTIAPYDWYVAKKPLSKLFPSRFHTPVFGSAYMTIMKQALVTLNIHTDVAGEAGNIRTFEATGAGTCLLVDKREGLEQLFIEGSEIVTYATDEECIQKLKYLIAHPDEAEVIAARGKTRTLQEHTSLQRCQAIDRVLKEKLWK